MYIRPNKVVLSLKKKKKTLWKYLANKKFDLKFKN